MPRAAHCTQSAKATAEGLEAAAALVDSQRAAVQDAYNSVLNLNAELDRLRRELAEARPA